MQEACRLVDEYFMVTARAVYDLVGDNAEKNMIVRIKAFLTCHAGKASRRELLMNLHIKLDDFDDCLEALQASGEVEEVLVKHERGAATRMICLRKDIVVNNTNIANNASIATVA